ncbi:hypothetical protein [Sandarakinorhabdus sp.]|jgi:hypothetical protein|uniref:hypothetical protein n=1 Tax=Sandarakinorhabdus sp. TaxID=1916663 RepID=UPI0033418FB8
MTLKILINRRTPTISELEQLIARAETALSAIAARRVAETAARAADQARLARIEAAAADAVAALDVLLAAKG